MNLFKKMTILILFSLAINLSQDAMASALAPPSEEGEMAKKMEAVRVLFQPMNYDPRQQRLIANFIPQEREAIPIEGSNDFGYSFPLLTCTTFTLLRYIQSRRIETKTHPVCYDFGSAFGDISTLMTLAGGSVRAIEKLSSVAKKARLRSYGKLKGIFPSREGRKEAYGRLTLCVGDATNLNVPTLFPAENPIEVAYMGYFLHFLTPQQIKEFLTGLSEKLSDDGIIYATVHAPHIFDKRDYARNTSDKSGLTSRDSDEKDYIKHFFTQKAKGNTAPGHLVSTHDSSSMRPATEDEKPGSFSIIRDNKGIPVMSRVFHYFDPEILERFFTDAGYNVIECFYIGGSSQSAGRHLSQQELATYSYGVHIIASKAKDDAAASASARTKDEA